MNHLSRMCAELHLHFFHFSMNSTPQLYQLIFYFAPLFDSSDKSSRIAARPSSMRIIKHIESNRKLATPDEPSGTNNSRTI